MAVVRDSAITPYLRERTVSRIYTICNVWNLQLGRPAEDIERDVYENAENRTDYLTFVDYLFVLLRRLSHGNLVTSRGYELLGGPVVIPVLSNALQNIVTELMAEHQHYPNSLGLNGHRVNNVTVIANTPPALNNQPRPRPEVLENRPAQAFGGRVVPDPNFRQDPEYQHAQLLNHRRRRRSSPLVVEEDERVSDSSLPLDLSISSRSRR